MKLRMYSIYDLKTEVFFPPLFAHNAGDAMRQLSIRASDPNSMFNRFPEDYRLYDIGDFDDVSAKIEYPNAPSFICNVTDVVKKKEEVKQDE